MTGQDCLYSVASPVAVVRADGVYRLLTTRAFGKGETVLVCEGVVVERPSRYSLQVSATEHLESPPGEDHEGDLDRRPWRFLNHSCRPNTRLEGRRLVAIRPLEPWEELHFDYNANETELASPFLCRCGASGCVGWVRGFVTLTAEEKLARRELLSPHLRGDGLDELDCENA